MREAGIGRVLVASLHQGIADILPTRLAFYENWLNAEGLREGTIGLAPLYFSTVLTFMALGFAIGRPIERRVRSPRRPPPGELRVVAVRVLEPPSDTRRLLAPPSQP